jgi:threonine dehydrogenase-like Zn-dependent dehydrogenase
LWGARAPEESIPGIILAVASLVIMPLVSFVGRELAVLGSMGYTLEELNRVVQLAAAGELDLSRSITARYPLERALEAFDDLHERRGDPVRLALLPARS